MTNPNDNTLTALDYIRNQEQLEKEASEALPGKFEKCTFPLGYVRQPIYACKTCQEDCSIPSGMCYSCSMTCHSEHELYELFAKRHFRCDCGLPNKFNGHPCELSIPAKRIIKTNQENTYNHNFQGLYCRCNQPYDPEKEEGTMYQCITCEDWFHEQCIRNIPKEIDDFECYVCRDCAKKYPFIVNGNDSRFSLGLSHGTDIVKTWILPHKIITADKLNTSEETPSDNVLKNAPIKDTARQDGPSDQECVNSGEKRKHSEGEWLIGSKRLKEGCSNVDFNSLPEHHNFEVFLQKNWRDGLCKCQKCLDAYKLNKIEFLFNEEETHEPEEDEDAGKSLLDIGMEQLQRIDRVQAIESLMAYKDLASDLKNYFSSFKDSNKIVTKSDIDEFFATKKRERK